MPLVAALLLALLLAAPAQAATTAEDRRFTAPVRALDRDARALGRDAALVEAVRARGRAVADGCLEDVRALAAADTGGASRLLVTIVYLGHAAAPALDRYLALQRRTATALRRLTLRRAVLRRGRSAFGGAVRRAGRVVPVVADVCGPLQAWRARGFAMPVPAAFDAYAGRALQANPTRAQGLAMRRAGRAAGLTERAARRWVDGPELDDVLFGGDPVLEAL